MVREVTQQYVYLQFSRRDDEMELFPVLALSLVLLALGIVENSRHQRNLKKIPIRIHVNGTRGKSTTTRLIAGILRQAGYRVVAKQRYCSPIIFEDGSEERAEETQTFHC